ncbi:MAG: J domain-containing protein [Caulobacteraceae bacterium]|nr:J domain-containing protein [Caulobacteraceae bacterium]
MAERLSPTTSPELDADPYAVLGVSPDAEDVVIRAAYRALLHKYTTPGRLPEDPVGDDARTRAVQGAYELLKDPEIRKAYDQHRREQVQAAAEAAAKAAPAAAVEPLVLNPGRPGRPARAPRRRSPGVPLIVGVFLLIALGAAALVLGRRGLPSFNLPASSTQVAAADSTAAPTDKPAAREGPPARPLPCYVDGHAVGTLPLQVCEERNGVATGQLENGLNGAPQKAEALPVKPEPAPPPPAPRAASGTAVAEARRVTPPASPPTASKQPLQPPDVDQSMAIVRAFYEALGDDDGARASSLVEPERRAAGPLSPQRITRFYSSLREPLKLTSIYPLDPSTIFVRYQFVTQDGRICTGAANVATTRRNDQVLIRGIRAYSGC